MTRTVESVTLAPGDPLPCPPGRVLDSSAVTEGSAVSRERLRVWYYEDGGGDD